MPDNVIVGEFVALLATVTLPLTAPGLLGANVTCRVAVWFGVRLVPATPLALKPVPEAVALEIVTFEFPVLVSVTFSELLLPSFTLLKFKLVGFALNRCVDAWPVPLSEIVIGEFGALLVSEIDPVTLPLLVGLNTALNVLLLPALIVIGSAGIPLMLKPAPVAVAWLIDIAADPPFVRLIVCESLVPIATVPKLALVGFAVSWP